MSLLDSIMQDFLWVPKDKPPKEFRATVRDGFLMYRVKEPVRVRVGDKVRAKDGGETFVVVEVPDYRHERGNYDDLCFLIKVETEGNVENELA